MQFGTNLDNIVIGLRTILPNMDIVGGAALIDGIDDTKKIAEIITKVTKDP